MSTLRVCDISTKRRALILPLCQKNAQDSLILSNPIPLSYWSPFSTRFSHSTLVLSPILQFNLLSLPFRLLPLPIPLVLIFDIEEHFLKAKSRVFFLILFPFDLMKHSSLLTAPSSLTGSLNSCLMCFTFVFVPIHSQDVNHCL